MKKVMVKAWEIAREGQKKFGGKVSEYLSEALKIAWAIVKKGAKKVSQLPKVVELRAQELFETGDQPTMEYARNKAEHEFNGLIKSLEKLNEAKIAKGEKPASIEAFKKKIANATVEQYLNVVMTANHAAKNL